MPHHSENVMDICVRVIRAASIGLGVNSVDVTWHGISRILAYATDFQ
jgi:hypothetical protein